MRKKLKEERMKLGLTQEQISRDLGISLRYYQKIEEGSRNGNFDIWDKLEEMTGISQKTLREITDDQVGHQS